MKAILPTSFALFALTVSAEEKPPPLPADLAGLDKIAEHLRTAVMAGDVEAVLKYFPEDGLPCGDAIVPSDVYRKKIREKGSRLHAYFFDEAAWKARFADETCPSSFKGEVEKGEPMRIERLAGGGPAHGCIYFSSARVSSSHICLIKEHGAWVYSGEPICDL